MIERVYSLDGVHLGRQFGQDGRLIARTGPYLQNPFIPLESQQLGHEGDHVGLGDGLVFAYLEGPVGVGPGFEGPFPQKDDGVFSEER